MYIQYRLPQSELLIRLLSSSLFLKQRFIKKSTSMNPPARRGFYTKFKNGVNNGKDLEFSGMNKINRVYKLQYSFLRCVLKLKEVEIARMCICTPYIHTSTYHTDIYIMYGQTDMVG